MISMIFKSLTSSFFMMSYVSMLMVNHPLTMGILIIFQSVFLTITLNMKFNMSWFSFLIFLIYLGGILMIFSYIISISFSNKPMTSKLGNLLILILFFPMLDLLEEKESSMSFKNLNLSGLMSTLYISLSTMSMFMLTFLFFIMTSVIFITDKENSRLKMN